MLNRACSCGLMLIYLFCFKPFAAIAIVESKWEMMGIVQPKIKLLSTSFLSYSKPVWLFLLWNQKEDIL